MSTTTEDRQGTLREWIERRQADDFEEYRRARQPEQEQPRRPRWLERAGKDLTGAVRTAA